MKRLFRALKSNRWAYVALLALASPLAAQDDPFGGPAGTPAQKPSASAGGGRAKPAEPAEADPVVLTLRETKPTTAEQLARAARVMLDYGRPDESKRYLAALAALNLDDSGWAALHAKYGTDMFVRWTQEEKIQPEGGTLGRAALTAARRLAEDSARLRQLVGNLTNPNPTVRRESQLGLLDAGVAAVPHLVGVIADPQRTDDHEVAVSLLVRIGPTITEPLIGVLESNDDALRGAAFRVLGALQARRAVPYLVRPALDESSEAGSAEAARQALRRIVGERPSRAGAELFLSKRIRGMLGGEPPVRLAPDDTGELWHWDAEKKIPFARTYPAHALRVAEATRLARELYRLSPDTTENRRLYIMTWLEDEKALAGADQPLPRGEGTAAAEAAKLGVDTLEDALAFAMKQNRPLAATAIVEVLGDIGTAELVANSSGGRGRPLSDALGHRDRRLRFAACEAVLKLDPQKPFTGASYLMEALGYFTASVGSRRILVAHPRMEDAQTLVGLLRGIGFEADQAQSGRGTMVRATKNPDYEYILISDRLDNPPPRELIQMLRQDSRTGELPIGILAEVAKPIIVTDGIPSASTYRDKTRPAVDPLLRAEQMSSGDSRTAAFARPYDAEGISFIIQRLEQTAGRGAVSYEERIRQAESSLEWLAKLAAAEEKYAFYEVARQQPRIEAALQTPALAARAAIVLGLIGTPHSQVALVDVASENGRSVEERDAAVKALQTAIKRRGLRLTREEIQRQYDRYNKSETLDGDTQRILGDVLDAIEAPTKGAANNPAVDVPAANGPRENAP